jgi:hypothetical protein
MSPVRKVMPGLASGHVEMPTFEWPVNCSCTRVVVRAARNGEPAISRLKKLHDLCPHRREHQRMAAEAQETAAEYWSVS